MARDNRSFELRRLPIGGAGTQITGGAIYDLDLSPEVRGQKWYGTPYKLGIGQQMLRDGHVRSAVNALMDPIRTADWGVLPAGKEPVDLEVAKFVEHCLFDRCLNFDDMCRLLLGYLPDGFSWIELTEDIAPISKKAFPLHPGNGKAFIYSGAYDRPANTTDGFIQDPKRPHALKAIRQRLPGSDGEDSRTVDVPSDRFVRITWDQTGANFAGLAPLRSAYGPWKIKQLLTVIDAIRHERQGMGTPAVKCPQGATDEQQDQAEEIAYSISANERGYVTLPFGYELVWISGGESTGMDIAIERCNRDIAFNLGSGFQLLGLQNNSPGSHALASTQEGQLKLRIEVHAGTVQNALNKGSDGWSMVERLVRNNYGPDVAAPKIVPRNLPTRNWAALMPVVKDLVAQGIITSDGTLEDFVRTVLKLPRKEEVPSDARRSYEREEDSEGDGDRDPDDGGELRESSPGSTGSGGALSRFWRKAFGRR